MKPKLLRAFRRGLLKVARTTGIETRPLYLCHRFQIKIVFEVVPKNVSVFLCVSLSILCFELLPYNLLNFYTVDGDK